MLGTISGRREGGVQVDERDEMAGAVEDAGIERQREVAYDLLGEFARKRIAWYGDASKINLRKLLDQAEGITRSPHFLREVILNCRRKGQSVDEIVRRTGLARDEIELILAREAMQAGENRTGTS